ncbi:hypothetical protein R5R35_006634 [Gryllus longicercus]|uniref:Accessory gland protein n=1 Tax=Gryllus longicercus TaxID=2509291 RepID=A0AAN9YZ11_9ORTH
MGLKGIIACTAVLLLLSTYMLPALPQTTLEYKPHIIMNGTPAFTSCENSSDCPEGLICSANLKVCYRDFLKKVVSDT